MDNERDHGEVLSVAVCRAFPKTPKVPDGEKITLGQAAKNLSNGTMPAFTLNTTVAESGGRFLLSNYMVPEVTTSNTEFLPAESLGPDLER